jgi:hypothetical protein
MEETISRFGEGTNNSFAPRKSEAAHVRGWVKRLVKCQEATSPPLSILVEAPKG